MAFIYGKVGEENRELWESIGWKNWGDEKMTFSRHDRWSADKERNIYMQPIGGFIDMPDYYDLFFEGRIVRMEVFCWTQGNRAEGVVFCWKIKRIYIPKSIWNKKEQVIHEINNSFKVVHNLTPIENVKEINVEIQCEPECVEVDYNGK